MKNVMSITKDVAFPGEFIFHLFLEFYDVVNIHELTATSLLKFDCKFGLNKNSYRTYGSGDIVLQLYQNCSSYFTCIFSAPDSSASGSCA